MSEEHASLCLIITTFASESEAGIVVRQLLEERLVACGTLLPGARSIYHWKGVLEEATEIVVLFKTDDARSAACMTRLAELHPYEIPEIIALDPESVSLPYTDWVKESLRKLD